MSTTAGELVGPIGGGRRCPTLPAGPARVGPSKGRGPNLDTSTIGSGSTCTGSTWSIDSRRRCLASPSARVAVDGGCCWQDSPTDWSAVGHDTPRGGCPRVGASAGHSRTPRGPGRLGRTCGSRSDPDRLAPGVSATHSREVHKDRDPRGVRPRGVGRRSLLGRVGYTRRSPPTVSCLPSHSTRAARGSLPQPATAYYAISRRLIHWESQSSTRARMAPPGSVTERMRAPDEASCCSPGCGPQRGRSGSSVPAPIVATSVNVPWQSRGMLEHPLSGDLFQSFAAAVA